MSLTALLPLSGAVLPHPPPAPQHSGCRGSGDRERSGRWFPPRPGLWIRNFAPLFRESGPSGSRWLRGTEKVSRMLGDVLHVPVLPSNFISILLFLHLLYPPPTHLLGGYVTAACDMLPSGWAIHVVWKQWGEMRGILLKTVLCCFCSAPFEGCVCTMEARGPCFTLLCMNLSKVSYFLFLFHLCLLWEVLYSIIRREVVSGLESLSLSITCFY